MNITEWMATYLIRTEARGELPSLTQRLVNAGNTSNRSAKALIYAFLDRAYADERWVQGVTGVSESLLREVRARNLKDDAVREPWHIDVLYGAYFATGDVEYLLAVKRVAEAPTHPLNGAANWSLGSLCQQFPHMGAALQWNGGTGRA